MPKTESVQPAAAPAPEPVTVQVRALYIGLFDWGKGEGLKETWRHVDEEGVALDTIIRQYQFKVGASPGTVWLITFGVDANGERGGYYPSGKNAPKYIGLLKDEEWRARIVLEHRANETLKRMETRRKAQEKELGFEQMSLEKIRAEYLKTNYQTRRAMLAQVLEYITRWEAGK